MQCNGGVQWYQCFYQEWKSVLDAQASQEEMVVTDSETDWHIKTKSPRSPRSHRSLRSPRSKNKENINKIKKKNYLVYLYFWFKDLGFGIRGIVILDFGT